MRIPWIFALAAAAAASPARAELSVTAQLSQDRVYVGEVVTLEITAIATGQGEVDIDVPAVAGLEELRRGQSDSTAISWTGGGQTIRRERTLRVDFEARKPGKLTIPPIEARLGRESSRTPPLTVVVGGEEVDEAAPAPGVAPQPGRVEPPDASEAELFVRYRVDKASAYVGEQILVDLDIFTNGSISLDELKPPASPDGFWREILERSDRLVARTERVGGREYRAYRLWRIALFGLAPGEHTVPATQLSFSASRSIFSSGQRIRRSTKPIKLVVEALPPSPRPVAGVGVLTLEASVDQASVPAGKGAVLTLALAGAANIGALKLPELKTIDGFRVFPPRVTDDVLRTINGVTGAKRAEILLMPTRAGRIEIPPITATVFNPEKRAYEDLSTAAIVLSAEGAGASEPAPATAAPAPAAASAPREALRPLRYPGRLDRGPPRFAGTRAFALSLGVPLLLLVLAVALAAARARPRAESASDRERRVVADARARLGQSTRETAFTDATEAVLAVAGLRTGTALRGLTREDTGRALRAAGVDGALIERLLALLERCDYARFAPAGDGSGAKAALTEAQALVDALAEAPLSHGGRA